MTSASNMAEVEARVLVAAAAGDADLAYAVCKVLKSKGLLACNGRQSAGIFNAPAYWPTEAAMSK